MTDRPTLNQLRHYIDGELPPDEARAMEARVEADASLRRAASSERLVRDRVKAVLGEAPPAPDALRAAVTDLLQADAAPESETPPPRTYSIWERLAGVPLGANAWAVAASILLVIGAVLVGTQLDPIDDWSNRAGQLTSAADVAEFAATEHGACATKLKIREQKLAYFTA